MVPQATSPNKTSYAASYHARNPQYRTIVEVQNFLSKTVTERMRQSWSRKSSRPVEGDIVTLHILRSFIDSAIRAETETYTGKHGSTMVLSSSDKTCSKNVAILDTIPDFGREMFPKIRVKLFDYSRLHYKEKQVELSVADFTATIISAGATVDESLVNSIAIHTRTDIFIPVVSVQEAAPFRLLALEFCSKGRQMLFACLCILGSTGGAWFGLTLSSMLPHCPSAGIYRSSCGQFILEDPETGNHESFVEWRPVGTMWSDGPNGYVMPATALLSDGWRDCIGFWMEYVFLFTFQCFKLQVRDIIGYEPYFKTIDSIRYALLTIEFLGLVTLGLLLRKKMRKCSWKVKDRIAFFVYLIMLSACLACVILGQTHFLKPEWKFYLTSKLIDPAAAVGSVAAMSVFWQEDGSVSFERWGSVWALGACTLFW